MPTITLPDDTEILLAKLAKHRGQTRDQVLAGFVEAWVEDLEDHVWAIVDAQSMAAGDAGPNVTHEEMVRELELADHLRTAREEAA